MAREIAIVLATAINTRLTGSAFMGRLIGAVLCRIGIHKYVTRQETRTTSGMVVGLLVCQRCGVMAGTMRDGS